MKESVYQDIPDSEDWRTDTDDPMVNAFREQMIYNNQFVDDPYVGIFWYDPNEDMLFGVYSALAADTNYYPSKIFNANARTCKALHYQVWSKEQHKRRKNPKFMGDYTKIPRGRIFEVENRGFVVCVGAWINEYPQAKELIIDEFQLPDDTEFLVDSHWDLGRGWSDKQL